jgi:hypothetical protein
LVGTFVSRRRTSDSLKKPSFLDFNSKFHILQKYCRKVAPLYVNGATIGGHRHWPLCQRYPTSDIDSSYFDIGTKYVGLILSFRYWKSSDIGISFHSDIGLNQYRIFRYLKLINQSQKTRVKFYLFSLISNSQSSCLVSGLSPLRYKDLHIYKSDI